MKYLLFFILIVSSLYSADVNKYNNIKEVLISTNGTTFFKTTYKEYEKMSLKRLVVKIILDKKTLENDNYYLSIISDINSLKDTNVKYKIQDYMMVIKLDKTVDEVLYFDYIYEKEKRPEFRFNILSNFEYKYILPFEGILYGLAYGIIFSAFLYYLVIYFSTRRICFLYYSSMQFFVLLSLIGFAYVSFKFYPKALPQAIIDICESAAFLFTFLFAKEILNSKKVMPFVNNILTLFVLLNLIDILGIFIVGYSLLYEYMNFYVSFLIPVIAGIIAVIKGNKNAIFYTLGWFMLFVFICSYEYDLIPLSGIYTIHIAAPLESLIFSFALAYMLRELVNEQNEKEKLLIHKSKLASTGEMINNIAHQWRQPLMHLGYINMNLEMSSSNNEFEKEYFVKKIKESNTQIKFMSKTIDDFSNFYKIEKEKQDFFISNACELAINIIGPTLKKKNITLNLDIKKDTKLKGYENEYAQVVLNLLTNCIDIFEIRKIKNPMINILVNNDKKTILKVWDNAKGIEDENLNNIFNPNFSTKKRGTGIGLYMSRIIIESHFEGKIYSKNEKNGACFIVEI